MPEKYNPGNKTITTIKKMDKKEALRNNLEHTLFSWSKQSGLNPIFAKRAEGVYIYDQDDKRYIDFSSQLMNVNIGHGDTRVNDAVTAQMKDLSFVFPGMATEIRGKVGKKLAEISPGKLNRTFFTLGGAEAVDNAIKIARLYTGRHKIIAKYRSYHGATYGAISTGGDPRKLQVDKMAMPGVVHVEDPYCYRCPWGQAGPDKCARECVSHIERVIQFEGPENIAAIIMEGESGSSGCIKYPEGYWRQVAEIARRHGILLIDDEVMSGFGRCGKWFAIENYGVEPDIICMAKGLTSGYTPLGGIIVSEDIASHFDDKPMMLGLTYSAHAVCLAAADAVIGVYESDDLIEQANKRSAYLQKKLAELEKKHPSIGDIRLTGLLGVIELVKNRDTKEPMAPWNASPTEMGVMTEVAAKIRELGMFTFVRWNWIFMAPPLIITEEQIDEGLHIISQAIAIADKAVD